MALEKLVVKVSEAAEMASVGRSKGYQLVASGEWPCILVGHSKRVPVEALKAWVERRMARDAKPPAPSNAQQNTRHAPNKATPQPTREGRPARARRSDDAVDQPSSAGEGGALR